MISPYLNRTQAFFGIWVIRATFILAVFGWGLGFYGPPIYLAEVVQRTNWSLSLVSSAVTLHFLVGALVIANLPRLYALIGLSATTVSGAVLTAAGVVGWAIVQEPWQLFCVAILTGAGWVTMGAVAVNAIIANWYHKYRPMALIGLWGFGVAASVVGLVAVVVVLLLAFYVFTKTPESLGQGRDDEGPWTEASHAGLNRKQAQPGRLLWRNGAFITLSAGMAIGLFAQIGLLAHLFNILSPAVGDQRMGWLMGLATACAIAGRSIAARAVHRFGSQRIVAAVGYVVQACGSAVLLLSGGQSVWLITVGVILFGSGIGNATSIPPLIAQSDFAPEDVSRVVALIVAIGQGTYAFAPAFFGLLQTDVYEGPNAVESPFFLVAIAIQLLAAAAYLAYRNPLRLRL